MTVNNVIKKSQRIPTVLVAGGAGFIGSYLAELFLEKGARVIVLDNFQTGKKSYVNHLLNNQKFALFDNDINSALPKEIESVDYIIHLAGLEEYMYSKEALNLDLLLTNSIGTKNLLDLALTSKAKFLLVSTLDVYTGMMSQLDLSKYFGDSLPEERKYSLTEAKRYAEALVWEYFQKHALDARIVRLPEVYGPKMSLDSSGELGLLLRDLVEGRDLTLSGEGARKDYYTFLSDAADGILKALFEKNTLGKIYTLVDKDSVSVLELAFLIKAVADRPTDIRFEPAVSVTRSTSAVPDTFSVSQLGWKPKVSLKEGLIKTLESLGYKTNAHPFKPSQLIQNKKSENAINSLVDPTTLFAPKLQIANIVPDNLPKKNSKFKFKQPTLDKTLLSSIMGVLVALSLVFVLLPFGQTYIYTAKAVKSATLVQDNLMQLRVAEAQAESVKTAKSFARANNSFNKSRWLYKLFGKSEQYESISKLLSSATYFSRGVNSLTDAFTPLGDIWNVIQPTSNVVLDAEVFNSARLAIFNAKSDMQLAQADFKYVSSDALPKPYQAKVQEYEKYLNFSSQNLDNLGLLVSDLPQLLGVNGESKYLILFQNNNEIRPTGGFIGSYALLTLKGGKMIDLKIDDIYNPDGQIDEQGITIVPPKPIADFLVEDRLYIRNANFNPDFKQSASLISDLYSRVTGDKVDGVIAIDLDFVKNILEVTGPIFLTAYNEEITPANLYERTQLHSDFNYQEGVSQKKSFLTVLGSKLLEKLFSLEGLQISALAGTVGNSLNERHVAIYLENSPVQTILKDMNWDGNLVQTDGDYLQIVNANLGGTKSNYYVDQTYKYTVSSDTRDGLLRAQVLASYNHTGDSSAWPGGPYTDYLRVLVQAGSKLTGAKIINKQTGVETDVFEDAVIDQVGKYTSFETSFIIQPKESVDVVIEYDLPEGLSLNDSNMLYTLVWQKQSGTVDDAFEFVFDYPFGMKIQSLQPQMTANDDIISTKGVLNVDQRFNTSFN